MSADTPYEQPPGEIDLHWLTRLIAALGLPLVTADLALHANGVWRVVEVGDGQVSDRPISIEPAMIMGQWLEDPPERKQPHKEHPLQPQTSRPISVCS